MPGDQAFLQLDQSIRQLIPAINTLVRMHRATLPQWYDLQSLVVRWCLGRDNIKELLRREIGYDGHVGKRVRVHIDDVLRIDELLRAGRDAAAAVAKARGVERNRE